MEKKIKEIVLILGDGNTISKDYMGTNATVVLVDEDGKRWVIKTQEGEVLQANDRVAAILKK